MSNDNTQTNEQTPLNQSLAETASLANQPPQLPIRVWWGFINPGLFVSPNKGIRKLRARAQRNFMPDTVYVMSYILTALIAYLPTVLLDVSHALSGIIPNEVALVVYKSIEEYNAAAAKPLGQLYQHIHAWLFAIPPSGSGGFPQLFKETFAFDKPCFLYTKENVDWQGGTTRLTVIRPKSGQSEEDFRQIIERHCANIQANRSAWSLRDTAGFGTVPDFMATIPPALNQTTTTSNRCSMKWMS